MLNFMPMPKLELKWKRFQSFEGWKLMYCDQVAPELYAVVPPEAECGSSPGAQLFPCLEDASAAFAKHADEIIQDYAEGGVVAYVESGRDCDGVDYWGRKHPNVAPTYSAYCVLHDGISDSADGPFYLELCRPSKLAKIEYESIDRVMEAFEDGHRHVIYSSFGG